MYPIAYRPRCCLKLASKGEHEFLVRNAKVGEKNSYTAISLMLVDSIHDLFQICKECPRLWLLHLVFQTRKFKLSKDYFMGMEDLKVMELNNSHIEFRDIVKEPSDIVLGQMLRSLWTLCLDYLFWALECCQCLGT